MNSELANLVKEEITDWNRVIFDVIQIPRPVYMECISSGLFVDLNKLTQGLGVEKIKDTEEKLERLCQSAPHVGRECIQLLSKSYGALLLMLSIVNSSQNTENMMRGLVSLSVAKGAVLTMLPTSPMLAAYQEKEKQKRSATLRSLGALGGQEKNRRQGYAELREWVLCEAKNSRKSHKDLAKALVGRLPEYLESVSKSPERFIYEVLREPKKLD